MSITLATYTASDQKGVKKVILNGFKAFGFKYKRKYDSDLDDPSIYIKNRGMFYVLKDDGKVIGTIAVINKGNKTGELKRLYVEKEYQGKGYGSMLFDKAVEFCKEKGFTKIEFETNKKFKKAHLLYKRRNFKIISEDERSFYMEKIYDF